MGNSFQENGQIEEAFEAYNRALLLNPGFAKVHRTLSTIIKYTADDLHFKQVLNLIDDEGLDEDARCNLSFALAKMYEDIGEIDKSFEYLSQGNRLRKKLLKYSIEDDIIRFRQLKKVQPNLQKYSRELEKISGNLTPIFILGMPRSGTTLVEQIISSHSKVSAAGELNHISRYGASLGIGTDLSLIHI